MKNYRDYDSILSLTEHKQRQHSYEEMKEIYSELQKISEKFNIAIIVNQKEYRMEIRG